MSKTNTRIRENALKSAKRKVKKLVSASDSFRFILFDNWRGYRLIYDTKEARACNRICKNCRLYKLLEDEPDGIFTASLLKATAKDKKLFGPQNFLNCKTFEQYKNCFVNFILKEAKTQKQVEEELELVKNVRVLFSAKGNLKDKEIEFRKDVIKRVLAAANPEKKKMIYKALKNTRLE